MNATVVDHAPSVELIAALNETARACRILEINGHGDKIFGHVAMRDPEGRGFWMKRHMVSLGEIVDWRDFLLLDFDGLKLFGDGASHSEWPIHSEIMLARPDLNYSCHSHPFHGVIYSSIPVPLNPIKVTLAGAPPRYEGSSELILDKEQGAAVAAAMGKASTVFLRNHGVAFAGATHVDLVLTGIELEHNCHQVLTANGSGFGWEWPSEEEQRRKFSDGRNRGRGSPLYDYYCRQLARAEAQGDPRLATKSVWDSDNGV